MTLDAIIAALRSSGPAPTVALTAAVAQAEALSPLVFSAAEKFYRGVHLLPGDSNLLFYGLHVLAVARHPDLLDQALAMARQPSEDLNRLFPEYITPGLSRILLNVWDRNLDDLLRLIEYADMGPEAKWVLYDVLGRLTCEGRFDRSQVTDFLARIERDGLIDDDDMTWWGWESTVVRLGLADLEPALRCVWDKPIFDQHNAVDHDDALQDLAAAAAQPGNPRLFDEEAVRPFDDVLEAVAWVDRRVAALADLRREREEQHGPDKDVARDERLTEAQLEWLGDLLVSRQVPPTAMSLEMLDGFLTALVLGPELVPMSQYLPVVWGTDDGEGPAWDGMEQVEYFHQLLAKHWNAIAARRLADAPHVPLIEHFGSAEVAEEWASGFLAGIDMRPVAWETIFEERRAEEIVLPILALCGEAPDDVVEQMTPAARGGHHRATAGDAAADRSLLACAGTQVSSPAASALCESRAQRALPVRLGPQVQALLRTSAVEPALMLWRITGRCGSLIRHQVTRWARHRPLADRKGRAKARSRCAPARGAGAAARP